MFKICFNKITEIQIKRLEARLQAGGWKLEAAGWKLEARLKLRAVGWRRWPTITTSTTILILLLLYYCKYTTILLRCDYD